MAESAVRREHRWLLRGKPENGESAEIRAGCRAGPRARYKVYGVGFPQNRSTSDSAGLPAGCDPVLSDRHLRSGCACRGRRFGFIREYSDLPMRLHPGGDEGGAFEMALQNSPRRRGRPRVLQWQNYILFRKAGRSRACIRSNRIVFRGTVVRNNGNAAGPLSLTQRPPEGCRKTSM